MATISDKLIQLKNIKQDIKEATNNLGGNVGDDFSTYAEAINRFATYENPNFYTDRTSGGTNFDYMFYGYNGSDIDVSNWDTSRVTSAQYCFRDCKKSLDISNWDLSSLTNAHYMFYGFTNNNTYLDLSVLDFSNVSKVNYMFGNSNTDYLDVRNINLTGATDYSNLFDGCSGTELDLSNWDINNVTNLYYTFNGSNHKKIDLTGWKTTNVKNFSSVFAGYGGATTHLIIPDWDMTNATSTSSFFNTSSSYFKFKYIDLSRSNDITINKIASFLLAKKATTYGEILIPADTSQDIVDALIAKYWKPIGPKLDLTSTELAFELDEIKPGKTTKIWTGNNDPWYGDDRLETIEFISSDESVATVNGREIIGVAEGTADIICRRREDNVVFGSKTLTVSETDSKPSLIKFRTNGSESSNATIIAVNGTNIKVNQCTKDVAGVYSYDPGVQITQFEVHPIGGSYPINEIIKFNFNAANITDMSDMFNYYRGTTLDISDWDTSNVTDMSDMFCFNYYLESIDVSNFDTSKVTNMGSMFNGCNSLESIDVSNFDTSKVTNMSLMFISCYKITSLDLSNFDTSNVKNVGRMFYECKNLKTITGYLDFSNLTGGFYGHDWTHPFNKCNELETVYLKNIYKNCKMTNEAHWSINLGTTKVKDECLLYIINELPNLYDKGLTNTDKIVFTLPPTNTLTEEQVQVAIDKGWTVANVNY